MSIISIGSYSWQKIKNTVSNNIEQSCYGSRQMDTAQLSKMIGPRSARTHSCVSVGYSYYFFLSNTYVLM